MVVRNNKFHDLKKLNCNNKIKLSKNFVVLLFIENCKLRRTREIVELRLQNVRSIFNKCIRNKSNIVV